MKFGLIDPRQKHATIADVASHEEALRRVGLDPGAVDHGTVMQGLAIVVGEFALFVPPEQQSYSAIRGYNHLIAGPALLYGHDEKGRTVDLLELPLIAWLPTRSDVERAIAKGIIRRPHIGIGDDVIWRWPGSRPSQAELDRLTMKIVESPASVVDGDTFIFIEPAKPTTK